MVLYVATPSSPAARAEMLAGRLGCITTPAQGNQLPAGVLWLADNGCGPGRDGGQGRGYPGDEAYLAHLAGLRDAEGADPCDPDQSGCLFAVCPDVVGDAEATARRARTSGMLAWIRYVGLPAAYVAQDGLEDAAPPWDDLDALFIGGSTAWKLGPHVPPLVAEARARGAWVHMGRVNSLQRLRYADAIGCHSADGTFLTFGPDTNLPRLLGWVRAVNDQGALFGAA